MWLAYMSCEITIETVLSLAEDKVCVETEPTFFGLAANVEAHADASSAQLVHACQPILLILPARH